jgi:hypothetical protein
MVLVGPRTVGEEYTMGAVTLETTAHLAASPRDRER